MSGQKWPLYPTPTVEEAEWALKQVWSAQKISQPLGFDPQIIRPVEVATLTTLPWPPGFKYIRPSVKLKFVLNSII